jgi:uncharacterized protein (TIGR01732 family)
MKKINYMNGYMCDIFSQITGSLHKLKSENAGGGKVMSKDTVGYGSGFALIVVLFILLIIIGTAYTGGYGGY